ncbi:MAG: hypothetical protein PHS35_02215 [Dehalococcoidales bacterium]|nr:hypothetical protein [Dehalococcoidales bacterium]
MTPLNEPPPEFVPEPDVPPDESDHLRVAVARGREPEEADVGRLLLPVTLRPPESSAIFSASLVLLINRTSSSNYGTISER